MKETMTVEQALAVADEMTAWATSRMTGPQSSRTDRTMVLEWAKRLRDAKDSAPGKDEFLHEVIVDELTSALEKTDLIASEIWQIADEIVRRATGAEPSEDAYVIEQMGRLLAEISVIVNGPEPANGRWSYHDLPAKVASLAATIQAQAEEVGRLKRWLAEQTKNSELLEERADQAEADAMNWSGVAGSELEARLSAEAELARVREDASRWRWLADQAFIGSANCEFDLTQFAAGLAFIHGADADAHIDAAMSKKESP